MGDIGPSRQRYEVLPLPAFDLGVDDRELLERAGAELAADERASTHRPPERPRRTSR